jgi:competence protein ComEC
VATWAESNHVAVHQLPYGSSGSVGDLTWRVLGPPPTAVEDAGGDEAINDASVVLAVRTSGVSLLLTGDVEAPAQEALLQWGDRALRADVLKVPHHGSADQDPEFLSAVRPRLAIVSVGADNDYGHPAPSTLEALSAGGATVARTDQAGEIGVVVRDGELSMVTR